MFPGAGVDLSQVKLKSSPRAVKSPAGGVQMPMFDPSAVKLRKASPKPQGEAPPAAESPTDFRSMLKKTNSKLIEGQ